MGRRERLERRAEKREAWADGARQESNRRFDAARSIADNIPLGQPILVGHHSEKRARKDQERIHSNMSRAVEADKRAADHISKAGGIRDQLDNSIFSDDPDAIEALEAKATALEAAADRCVALNKEIRRELKNGDGWLDRIGATEDEKLALARNAASWRNKPEFPSYHLTNLRANARRCRERIVAIKRQTEQTAKAEASGGLLVEKIGPGYGGAFYARITFEDYPGRPSIDELKAAGFSWSRPSWIGSLDKLPERYKGALA